jgi:hypothetical protein
MLRHGIYVQFSFVIRAITMGNIFQALGARAQDRQPKSRMHARDFENFFRQLTRPLYDSATEFLEMLRPVAYGRGLLKSWKRQ